MIDKRQLCSEKWVGVIIRNIPPTASKQILVSNVARSCSEKVIDVQDIKMIKNQYCTIMRVDDLETAEQLCRSWNGH